MLRYDPGVLPTKPAPAPGDEIKFVMRGLPPMKEVRRSIRNPEHPTYERFTSLRSEAIRAMDGRAWSDGAIELTFVLHAPTLSSPLIDFIGGIEDTLDGSHGFTFTYLPVVFEDDCQVVEISSSYVESPDTWYEVGVRFLGGTSERSLSPLPV